MNTYHMWHWHIWLALRIHGSKNCQIWFPLSWNLVWWEKLTWSKQMRMCICTGGRWYASSTVLYVIDSRIHFCLPHLHQVVSTWIGIVPSLLYEFLHAQPHSFCTDHSETLLTWKARSYLIHHSTLSLVLLLTILFSGSLCYLTFQLWHRLPEEK